NLRDDLSLGIFDADFLADTRVGRPSSPVPGRAMRLPRAEHAAFTHDVAAGLHHFESLLSKPLLHVVLARTESSASLPAVAMHVFLDAHCLEAVEAAVGK